MVITGTLVQPSVTRTEISRFRPGSGFRFSPADGSRGTSRKRKLNYASGRPKRKTFAGRLTMTCERLFSISMRPRNKVAVAKQNVGLANESLARSKDRFTSGVTDSVEVVQAEQSLASANDQYITSLYDHNLAKLSLARALGVARTNYEQYLGGK